MDEAWDLDVPPLPERSRLYHLKPIGIDTAYVESLTSYVIRLAEAHCVLPGTLVMSEILPLLGQPSRPKTSTLYSYNALLTNVQSLNGMGTLAKSCVEALEKLTKRNNLCALTMLTWANVITKQGLLRETQAWCPLCYEEWRVNKNKIYYPLLWSLKVVKVCLLHRQILQERCPSSRCQKSLPIFATKLRLGYCPYCNNWLGGATVTNSNYPETIAREETEQAHWNAVALGELLEVAPHLSSPLQKEDLALAVNRLIDCTPVKKTASLAHLLEISPRAIRGWQLQSRSPQLETLLQTCRFLGISPQHLFFEKSGNSIFTISRGENAMHYKNLKKLRNLHDPEELRRSLEEVLASEEEPFPSVQEVARRLGYRDKSQIYRYFPELAHAITVKYRKHRKSHANQKLSPDELQQALEAVLTNENPPPSIQEVALRLGYRYATPLRKRFPELASAIAVKYRQYNPAQREPMSLDELQQALETALASDEEPPPSLQEVALRLGYRSATPLRSRCPELAHAITARRQKYSSIHKKRICADKLRQALEAELASDEEPPPSLQEVALRLGYRSETSLYGKFSELSHKIVAKHRKYKSHYQERISSSELRQALERILASDEDPFPSIQEVTLRLGYRSERTLYKRFPELAHAIAVKSRKHNLKYKERISSDELRQVLEVVLANQEEAPLSVLEVAQRLGYRSERTLYKRFPQLSQAIALRYRKYKLNRQTFMSLDELRQALEAVLTSDEEPPPSIQEVAQRLGYRHPAFLYKRFPQLARAISLKKRNSERLQQALETLLENADPPTTQQEIAKCLGCSIKKLHQCFPELPNALKKRRKQPFDIEGLQLALEKELLSSEEPRSLTEVAQSLGHSVWVLVKMFPSLCQKIVDRRKVYRRIRSELRKQKIEDEVRRVVFSIHAEQNYPSLHQTLKLVDRSCVYPPLFYLEAYVPWRKTLEDLGYRK